MKQCFHLSEPIYPHVCSVRPDPCEGPAGQLTSEHKQVCWEKLPGRNKSDRGASGRQSGAPLLRNRQLPAFTSNNSKRGAPVLPPVALLRFPKLQESNQTIFKRWSQKDLALLFLSICAEPASDTGLHQMAISQWERTDL